MCTDFLNLRPVKIFYEVIEEQVSSLIIMCIERRLNLSFEVILWMWIQCTLLNVQLAGMNREQNVYIAGVKGLTGVADP